MGNGPDLLARIPPAAFTGVNERRAWTVLIQAGSASDNPIGDLAAAGLPKDAILAWADLDRFGARTATAESEVMGAEDGRRASGRGGLRSREATAADLGTTLVQTAVGSRPDAHIILPGRHVSIMEAGRQIFTVVGKALRVFYRGGRVHEIVVNPDGTRCLDPISPAQFRKLLGRIRQHIRVENWCERRAGSKTEPLSRRDCPRVAGKLTGP